ncbi:MAG: histidinol-phosphate transaminase, partial [Saprospiraceae bacterium]|nr:histidinol-phosphate transaminase [Saprospiraceae bacterium]
NQIFLGNGSDEAIDLLIRIFCEPGDDEIMVLPPTYGMYQVCADVSNVAVKKCLLTDDFQLQLSDIRSQISTKLKLLFICSPNNPTGNSINHHDIESLLTFFKGIVIIDEAYGDFCEQASWIEKIGQYPNLVILQTFSKAWGLAGIRMGMAFSNPEIISIFNKVKPPYNINRYSQMKAIKSLQEDAALKDRQVKEIIQERAKLRNILIGRTDVLEVYPSEANFLLIRFANPQIVYRHLQERGIVVRDRTKTPKCEGCLRITIGTPEENNLLIDALNQLL